MAGKKPNPVDTHVGSRVRLRRMLLGMSQERLGDSMGLTFQQVQKYEKGVNRIGASRLFQISKILDVPVQFFFEEAPHSGDGSPARAGMAEPDSEAFILEFLLGPLKKLHRRLFEKIDWSTDRVYRQTITRAEEIGLPVAPLAEWYDVDDEATLAVLARELLAGPNPDSCYRGGYAAPSTTGFLAKLRATNGEVRRLIEGAPQPRC